MSSASPSAFRQVGYRLLGPRFDYLLHTRPAEWPIMAAHTALGYLLAVGLAGAVAGESLSAAALGLVLWVVFLNGGTLAINSAFDKDEGDIGYLRRPPPVPTNLFGFGMALLVTGGALSLLLPPAYTVAYAVCFVMSVLYSVPPFRFKAVAGVDWVINMVGFGALTPYAGWALTGRPMDRPALLVFAAFAPLFASLYPLTQIYQFEEDRRRGDRTLALMLGERASLFVAIGAAAVAFALFFLAGMGRGWLLAAPGGGWRAGLLAVAFAAWMIVLIPWAVRCRRMTPAQHQVGMYAALGAWAVTDVAVALGFGLA
ncbi:MAG TPA: UbiA family prenyltransferase [Gemmatimonadales bacterium]|nr:UbiA family prenyltransferase [Gemmatimonadales bacterium]